MWTTTTAFFTASPAQEAFVPSPSCTQQPRRAGDGISRQLPTLSVTADGKASGPIPFHPCLHPVAHHTVARLHLPVAPACNLSCGYCEREVSPALTGLSAPGLSGRVLTPEQALEKTRSFLARWGHNAVVGVAGPGEPLANRQTIETLTLVRREFPEIPLCLCTNGLELPDRCADLAGLGVQHLTVTINGFEPSIVALMQPLVRKNGITNRGETAAKVLIENQVTGLKAAIEAGMVVKVNCVVVPEINGPHAIHTAQKVKDLGVSIFNPMPLIPRGSFRHMPRPDDAYMAQLRDRCSGILPVFSLCKQCRADAEGIPGEETTR
jgi:nitrogen fixation protein NifB